MAIRPNHPRPRPDNTKTMAGGAGTIFRQEDGGKLINRSGAASEEADFDIIQFDLVKEDMSISDHADNQFEGDYPDIGGTREIGLFLESEDDEAFEVEVRFVDQNNNVLARVDKHIHSGLDSSSPDEGNHFVFETVAVAGDYFDVVVIDQSDAVENRINGTINAH